MHMKKRNVYLSRLLVVAMLGGLLASCGGGEEPETTRNETETDTQLETEAETTEREGVSDDLPEMDFDDATFTFLTFSPSTYKSEELNADLVNDEIYYRNSRISDRFHVKIETIHPGGNGVFELEDAVKASVMVNDHAYDIAVPHQIQSGPTFILNHWIIPWNDVPYINTEKPWWNQENNEAIRILDQQYYLTGYITMPTPFCMFVNNDMLAANGYESMYQTVRDGRWTLDLLKKMTAEMSVDLNGDGVYDKDDQWGIGFNNDNHTLTFMYAADIMSVLVEDGKPVPNTNTEKMASFIESMYDLIYNDSRTWFVSYATQGEITDAFQDDRMLFICGIVEDMQYLREMESSVGLIPYPKWDEEQDAYHTNSEGSKGMLCIPKTPRDLEMVGAVVEAMAAETWKYVIPAFYDVTLGNKLMNDPDSVEMMDICFDGLVYDFGYVFDKWNGCTWTVCNMMLKKTTDLASYWKSIEKKINRHYEVLYQKVEKEIAEREEAGK